MHSIFLCILSIRFQHIPVKERPTYGHNIWPLYAVIYKMTDDIQKLDALNRDYTADIREMMFYLLALEQAKRDCFEGFKKDYSSGQDIDKYVDWHQHQDTAGMDMPLIWSRTWLHRYLDEYKKNGILNLKFKLWTRCKMFFWLPPRN